MDGNGRWAKQHKLPRVAGHRKGTMATKRIVKACGELDIKYLTIYVFSSENWKRPLLEVSALMKLLIDKIHDEIGGYCTDRMGLLARGKFLEKLKSAILSRWW